MILSPFNKVDFIPKKSIFFVDTPMNTRIQKWGNSLALRIPHAFAKNFHLTKGSAVELSLEDGKLVITPVQKNSYTLKQLLAGVSKQNLHSAVDWGPPMGKEIW